VRNKNRKPPKGAIIFTVLAILLLSVLWFLRPLGIIHGPVLYFYKYPLLWVLPLLAISLTALVVFILYQKRKGENYYPRDRLISHGFFSALFASSLLFIFALIISPILTGNAIYKHYGPFEKTDLPQSGLTRIMPKGVAEVLARNGFASPTETLENAHIINSDSGLIWTFGQSPDGSFRRITKKTAGSASLLAKKTTRDLKLYEEEFQVAPGHLWSDSVTWKAYKKNFFTDVAESIYIPGKDGGRILVPYVAYEGFLVKVPVLGGAYLISPDGKLEDLTPEEAASNPYVKSISRLFPSTLARRVQDSFIYVDGIWNRIFTHREILTVKDRVDEGNVQPHFSIINDQGTWVSVGEPWGRSDAVSGVFLTDAITGKTSLWRAKEDAGLTSSRRAQDATESLAIPGVSFRAGDFKAIEPRAVFRDKKLYFLVSIVPRASSTVSKSVIIEPATNKAVAVFSHSDDPRADEKLTRYLLGKTTSNDLEVVNKKDKNIKNSNLSAEERSLIKDLLKKNREERESLLRLLGEK
jgi:hypothetical protein